jgi:hypothetical protein
MADTIEKYNLMKDIELFCITAELFPDGILAAHQKLHSLLPTPEGRNFFGISRPNNKGTIIYKAAVEESYEGEAEKYGCETFVLKKGDYISTFISNYRDDITSFSRAFKKLLADPKIDPNGYCVEMYLGEQDVRCMVRLNSNQ